MYIATNTRPYADDVVSQQNTLPERYGSNTSQGQVQNLAIMNPRRLQILKGTHRNRNHIQIIDSKFNGLRSRFFCKKYAVGETGDEK